MSGDRVVRAFPASARPWAARLRVVWNGLRGRPVVYRVYFHRGGRISGLDRHGQPSEGSGMIVTDCAMSDDVVLTIGKDEGRFSFWNGLDDAVDTPPEADS